MTNLYEIKLPLWTNGDAPYQRAHDDFRAIMLTQAGGYTAGQIQEGFWRDPKDGKVYTDTVQAYQVATDPATWEAIVFEAFGLFHDQKAIFTAEIGRADIRSAPAKLKLVV